MVIHPALVGINPIKRITNPPIDAWKILKRKLTTLDKQQQATNYKIAPPLTRKLKLTSITNDECRSCRSHM